MITAPNPAEREQRVHVMESLKACGIEAVWLYMPGETDLASAMRHAGAAESDVEYLANLSLKGELRPIKGALGKAEAARNAGKRILVPSPGQCAEVQLAGLPTFTPATLRECLANASRFLPCPIRSTPAFPEPKAGRFSEFADTRPPMVIDTHLEALDLVEILPQLTYAEALDITRRHSDVGLLHENQGLMVKRPFRAPHHSASPKGLAQEVQLARGGVLLLTNMDEWPKAQLDLVFWFKGPDAPWVVATMRRCPCQKRKCVCSPALRTVHTQHKLQLFTRFRDATTN